MFLHPGSIIQSIGLNIVRALSLISLLWVLLSAIIDMNTNVKAVNAFEKNRGDFTLVDCEYIELSDFLSYHFFYSLFFFSRGSSVPNQLGGIFWAFMSSLLIIFETIILARQFPSGRLLTLK